MGKESKVARSEEKGRSVLLVSSRTGLSGEESPSRQERREEPNAPEGYKGGKVKDTKNKSKTSSKAERTDAGSSKSKGHRPDNSNRKSHRRDEGEDTELRRSAQDLGVTYPGSFCRDGSTRIIPHHWLEVEKVHRGSLLRCRNCRKHIWLPTGHNDSERLGINIKKYGETEGYCRFLNTPKKRAAKVLIAKIQQLERLTEEMSDKAEVARAALRILGQKDYDKV